MKNKKTRSSGGGRLKPSAYGPGGVNTDGPSYKNIGFNLPHTFAMKSPDSMISQRMQQTFPVDYFEDSQELDEDQEETLEEFFARMIKMPLTEQDKKEIIDEDEEENKNKEVDEISAGGSPGVAMKMGLGPDGKKRKKGGVCKRWKCVRIKWSECGVCMKIYKISTKDLYLVLILNCELRILGKEKTIALRLEW